MAQPPQDPSFDNSDPWQLISTHGLMKRLTPTTPQPLASQEQVLL